MNTRVFYSGDSRAKTKSPYNNPNHSTNTIKENTSWEEQSLLLWLIKASGTDAWTLPSLQRGTIE
jgi:hypothetical protein